jgi:ABC-2 type transport system permease protein
MSSPGSSNGVAPSATPPETMGNLVRIFSFTGKELRETLRRPGVVASLILGPFLIMFIFGMGYSGYRQPFDTYVVLPEGAAFPTDPAFYEELAPGRVTVRGVGGDEAEALGLLEAQEIDLVVIAPSDAANQLRAGQQTVIRVIWNEVDPVYDNLAHLATSILVSNLNAEIVEVGAEGGIALAEGELGPAVDVPPEVIARPTTSESENVAPTQPDVLSFFGPAVFALVIQHLAITLTALSLVRERLSGQMDRYRVAPVSSTELLVGKYIAYAVVSLAVTAIVGALLVFVLEVPLLGGWAPFAGIVLLLTFASLGVGLLISLVADSERGAVQLSMLVLLASVFFSGFVLPVEDFAEWTRYIAYALPVTHGIAALHELMLRGAVLQEWTLAALAGIGAALYLVTLLRLRRVLRSAA